MFKYTVNILTFNIGYTFYYWEYYKDMIEFDNNHLYGNYYDHGGYSPKELYITPKYSTFKEEVTNYKHITMRHYNKIIKPKLTIYMKSEKVHSLRVKVSRRDKYRPIYRKLGDTKMENIEIQSE